MAVSGDYDDYDDDDISTLPFTQQPVPGVHRLWRRPPIRFVSAGAATTTAATPTKVFITAEQYQAIINTIPGKKPAQGPEKAQPKYPLCETCGHEMREPTRNLHYSSLNHMLSQPVKPVPSAMDRERVGYKILQKDGFDIDSQKGLGRNGEGMLAPIKPVVKDNTLGLGFKEPKSNEPPVDRHGNLITKPKPAPKIPLKTDAGAVRKRAREEKKRDARLRQEFYGNDDIEKYLGPWA
ncbi:hypothetical protein BS50DRAFT_568298 [Corynespora cassiicola Philippines]|uniref:G-patch domain-containing protein n=1 Tax=Corynespora cassiicola Philippines TaxID=1448308 RepID=A0A2T2P5V3_CORCC|nr:hypothetical protein BS50DRAFT_568298 [Corynespora cassiicola Philippines]